jgi:hypothetical protein
VDLCETPDLTAALLTLQTQTSSFPDRRRECPSPGKKRKKGQTKEKNDEKMKRSKKKEGNRRDTKAQLDHNRREALWTLTSIG